MSYPEIKQLRQSGNLEAALKLAEAALLEDPENIWNKRAIGWVFYDYLKQYAQPESFDAFMETLEKINALRLPADEKMLFDTCGWKIGSMVFALANAENSPELRVLPLFEAIRGNFHFSRPSDVYSFLLKAFHKIFKNHAVYVDFLDWWGIEHLQAGDYLQEEFQGQTYPGIAENCYNTYARHLVESIAANNVGNGSAVVREKIQVFLPKLDKLIENHPKYQYPPFYKAKLLLALGDEKNSLSAFLPFARQKRNDFWVWQLLAETFHDVPDTKFACYCKALSLKTPDEFLVKIRQTFVSLLLEKKYFDEAKTEIHKILDSRQKNGWKIPTEVASWVKETWYTTAEAKPNNNELYSLYKSFAEEVLYEDLPEEIVVVEFVNEGKSVLNFVKNQQVFGFFKYDRFLKKPRIGDILSVRFNGKGENGYFKVFTIRKAAANTDVEAIKAFDGVLQLVPPNNFGFVNEVYVDAALVKKLQLVDRQQLKGKAIMSFNKKKNEWGWKALPLGYPPHKFPFNSDNR